MASGKFKSKRGTENIVFSPRARKQCGNVIERTLSRCVCTLIQMSFNPGTASSVDDKNVFCPDEVRKIDLQTQVISEGGEQEWPFYATPADHNGVGSLIPRQPGLSMVDALDAFYRPVPNGGGRVGAPANRGENDTLVAIYTMLEEDHGVGQLLRQELQRDPRVSFAAYRIPHPQEAVMKLRFHTRPQSDPQTILNDAIDRCILSIDTLAKSLKS